MSQTATMTATKTKSPVSSPSGKKSSLPSHSLLASFVPPAKSPRLVTPQELADNCGIGSDTGRAWMAVHGHVFDVTDFSKVHPGGQTIRLGAGRDATCLIESYHPHSSIARVEAALFTKATYVGALQQPTDVTTEKAITSAGPSAAYKRPSDAFFLDVRARVDAFIHASSDRYAYDALGQAEAFLTLFVYFIAIYQVGVYGSWAWTLILGVLTGRMGILMHMGNHCAVAKDPRRNQLIGWFMDLIGSNATIWGYEHQVAHHGEPNEFHHDNDCEIGAPIVRMHPEIPHTPTMAYQHFLIPAAMTIGFFKWYVGDFEHFVRKHVGNVRMAIDRADWHMLLSFKAFWFLIHVVIPVYFNGVPLALAQCFVFMGIGGHYLENIFIVNHIQNGLVPPPEAHWADKQVMATSNWKSGSILFNWISGGLNHQVEHHMFPSLSMYWYPHIHPIVAATCAEHGLPYTNYADFTTAWMEMFRYLRDLGDVNFVSKTGQKGAPPMPQGAGKGKVHAA